MATPNETISMESGLGGIAELLRLVTTVQGQKVGDQTQTTTESGGPVTESTSFGSSSSTPGDLGPLQAVLAQQMPLGTMEGMAPILQAIFADGAKQLPDLYSKAGATGSRVQQNSIIAALQNQLGADLANKVALLLSANQQASAKTAEAIAREGRRTSSSQGSRQTTTPGTRTSTTTRTGGSTSGPLGNNGLQKLIATIGGGSLLRNFAGPAASFLTGLFGSGGAAAGGDLGTGLTIGTPGPGLQVQDYSLGLQPPPSAATFGNFPGLSLDPTGTSLASFGDQNLGGQGLQLPPIPEFNLPEISAGDFGTTYTPPDFSSFGASLGDLGYSEGFQVPTFTATPDVAPADYVPTDFSSFGTGFGGEGLKLPEDLASWFSGNFADGGAITRSRGSAKYTIGVNPILERIGATNYQPQTPRPTVFAPGAAASFGGSNPPAVTQSSARPVRGNQSVTFDAQGRLVYTANPANPEAPPTAPTPIDRAALLAEYRKTLPNQDLYSADGNTLSVWKDPTPYNVIDPETGLPREDPFAGFAQEAKNMMNGTPDVFDARRKDLAQRALAEIKAKVPISMSLEQAVKFFPGIESLRPEIQQAIADDPRRFAASMKGLLPITDPKLKDWKAYSREGDDYAYSSGGRLEPLREANAAMQWHPQFGLLGPPGAIAPYYEESTGALTPIIGPALTAASFVFPVLAPFAAAYSGMQAAKNDDTLGFFASMVGLGGAAAGLSGSKDLARGLGAASTAIKVGDAYFRYQDYKDYQDKLEAYNRRIAEGDTTVAPPETPTPVEPPTQKQPTQTQVTGAGLQQQAQRIARGGPASIPTNEKIFGANSVLEAPNLSGAGSPAYASGADVTLASLPSFLNLAESVGGISSASDSAESLIPKRADGGSMGLDFRMMQVDKLTGYSPRTLGNSSPVVGGGTYSIDEEFAKSKGITVKQLEAERNKKLQDALKRRKVPQVSGFLKGIGGPTSDSLLIAASPSEYVLPSDVTAKLGGPAVLDEILALLHTPA